MFPKNSLAVTVLLLCCLGALFGRSEANYCSLDRMKELAMKACEHLFETFDVRERRSIDYGHTKNSVNSDSGKYYRYVRRSCYPKGGYLKVGLSHYRKLSKLQIDPPYKPKKPSQHDEKLRFKRNDNDYGNSISYCCYHRCDEDFFC